MGSNHLGVYGLVIAFYSAICVSASELDGHLLHLDPHQLVHFAHILHASRV